MLIIRTDQLAAVAWPRFAERVLQHARQRFPTACAAWTDERLRPLIVEGMTRAAQQGFTTERDVSRFLNLMFIFGHRFDLHQPWARRVLAGTEPASEKAARLYAEGIVREPSGCGLGSDNPPA